MKRFVCFLLIFVLLLSLCACGGSKAGGVEPRETEAAADTPDESGAPENTDSPDGENNTDGTDPVKPLQESINVILTDADATGLNLPDNMICVVDENGMQILITLCGDAKQVRLCAVNYDENLHFMGTGDILWAGGDLKAGSQIGLRVFIPDVCPNVALCYKDAAGEHCCGIFQSGEDGSLFFVDLAESFGTT